MAGDYESVRGGVHDSLLNIRAERDYQSYTQHPASARGLFYVGGLSLKLTLTASQMRKSRHERQVSLGRGLYTLWTRVYDSSKCKTPSISLADSGLVGSQHQCKPETLHFWSPS